MTAQNVQVKAVPLNAEISQFSVECSLCGPLTITNSIEANDTYCLGHLEDVHGVDVSGYRKT